MNIVIGSENPTKIKSVQDVFEGHEIISRDAKSMISPQPYSDEETRMGAVNRAKECAESASNVIGIGLEGGVMKLANDLYLCNWGALATEDEKIFTASGARIVLPVEIAKQLKSGIELGDVMDDFTHRSGIRNKEGAIGIFTNDLISRAAMFMHVATLLKGQWDYFKRNSKP